MDLDLKGKVAIVSGGANGIGAAISTALVEEGCRVAVLDRSCSKMESEPQDGILEVKAELSNPSECRAAIEHVDRVFGHIDALVNNAGANDSVGIGCTTADFMTSLSNNLQHYFSLMHLCFDQLKQSKGCVVNISSKVSVTGQGQTSGYVAAKGAINGLTREWALCGAPFGVRVNTVVPAEVWTTMYERWLSTRVDGDSERERIEQSIPLGRRFTMPEEIAAMVAFLASNRSSHTTGQIIFVDGGYTHLDRRLTS